MNGSMSSKRPPVGKLRSSGERVELRASHQECPVFCVAFLLFLNQGG